MRYGMGSPYIDLLIGVSKRMHRLRLEKARGAGPQRKTNHRPKTLKKKWLGSKDNSLRRRRKEMRNEPL